MYYIEFDSQQGSFSIGQTLWGANNSESGEIALVVQNNGVGALFFNDVVSFDNNEIVHINSLSSEKLLNWDFSAWVGDDPTSWIHHDTENSSNFVTEVSSGARFLSDGTVNLGIKQQVLSQDHFYYYEIQITEQTSGALGLWNDDWIVSNLTSVGIFNGFFQCGSYSTLMILRGFGSGDQTVGYISVKEAETAALINGTLQQMSDGYMLGINITDAIEIKPLWNYRRDTPRIGHVSRTYEGKMFRTTLGHYNRIEFDVEFVTSEHMTIINSWWESGAELLLFITSDTATEVNSVIIANELSPIGMYHQNTGYFKGSIELEGY